MAYDYDVYFAHAWEDKAALEPLVAHLRSEGLRVWYDDNELESGTSLRAQLDRGMLRSRLGVVVLSRSFFSPNKLWAPAEFDVWLDQSQGSRILVVWLDVEKNDVAAWSPIAATLFARRHSAPGFAEQLVGDIKKKTIDNGIYAAFLRNALERNMQWVRPPQFFTDSLDAIDTDDRWTHVDAPLPREARSVDMGELFRATPDYAGQLVIVAGRPWFTQVLAREMPVQQFALQLGASERGLERCMVQTVACKVDEEFIDLPRPPSDRHLAVTWGWIVGRGGATFGEDVVWQTVVMLSGGYDFVDLSDPTTMTSWPSRPTEQG